MQTSPEEDPSEKLSSKKNDFETQADEKRQGLIAEFLDFLRDNQKWWLLPILIVAVVLGALVLLGPSVLPFMYPLF